MSGISEVSGLAGLGEAPAAHAGVVKRVLERMADGVAMAGGLVFVALIGMSIVSIVGRKLFAAPIQGDVELMQMGAAVGAAAFLPYCQIHDHHIKVDAFTGWLPSGPRSAGPSSSSSRLALRTRKRAESFGRIQRRRRLTVVVPNDLPTR